MKLKNKNGFITIYVIISMMFFIIFVMSALIIASRKLKLQAETNESLYNIFNSDVKNIVSDSDEVFVYNKEQFVEIMKWFYEDDPEERSFYINNIVYTLENDKKDDYKLVLKDDIYLSGVEAINYEETDEEIAEVIKEYVPSDEYLGLEEENEEFDELIESFLDEENNRLNMEDFHIYLQVKDEEENIELYPYKWEVIKITTPEEFMKIATGEYIGTYRAISTATYDIVKDINLEKYFYEPDEEDEEQKKEIFNLLTNRPDFNGILYSSNNSKLENIYLTYGSAFQLARNEDTEIIEEPIDLLNSGVFSINNGVIKDLIIENTTLFLKNTYEYSNELNLGLFGGINNGIISNITLNYAILYETRLDLIPEMTAHCGVMTGINNNIIDNIIGMENIELVTSSYQISGFITDNYGKIILAKDFDDVDFLFINYIGDNFGTIQQYTDTEGELIDIDIYREE